MLLFGGVICPAILSPFYVPVLGNLDFLVHYGYDKVHKAFSRSRLRRKGGSRDISGLIG